MDYIPNPLDDSAVSLPEELEMLTEDLAKNVHEVWAAGMIADGWKYGKVRDEARKEHPCLIPYEELSEEEKDYDRATALSTLKFILAKGFRVVK